MTLATLQQMSCPDILEWAHRPRNQRRGNDNLVSHLHLSRQELRTHLLKFSGRERFPKSHPLHWSRLQAIKCKHVLISSQRAGCTWLQESHSSTSRSEVDSISYVCRCREGCRKSQECRTKK